LIACLNGIAWSIITPPFQGRDEPSHFAYVQQLAETETLPHVSNESPSGFSPEEELVLVGVHQYEIKLSPEIHAISSMAEQRILKQDLSEDLSNIGSGYAGTATSEPPLYYAIEMVPYAMGAGNTLVQLELMRLSDALIAGITALLIFFFVREVLPGVPWAATIGAACVSVQPLFGFMSGTLNPDNMLYTMAAGLFLCLARGFRRGLSRGLAVVTGLVIATGFMTKLNFIGLSFGGCLGLMLLGVRKTGSKGGHEIKSSAIGLAIGVSPILLYMLVNGVSGNPTLGPASEITHIFDRGRFFHELTYMWQLYLPRLPGMTHFFAGMHTYRDIWFDRSVGLYGWLDTSFPRWVTDIALVIAGAVSLLFLRALVVKRKAVRSRLLELLSYTTISVGMLAIVAAASYSTRLNTSGVYGYGDPRYLLPMLPLLGAVVALAVRGAGRRWAPAAGAIIITIFLAHDILSQLQVIARYYG
jgi:4-amino-4-deoxy-L-arabinose transferase-like glycosyltransferase